LGIAVSGENSDYILPQDAFSIKQQFPNSEIVKIKNAGHWIHADNPKDFMEIVKVFFGK
jgi:pimeloyl-ACP methyl ester carboxylesterase